MDGDSHLYSDRFHDYSLLHYATSGARYQPFIAGRKSRKDLKVWLPSMMMTMMINN